MKKKGREVEVETKEGAKYYIKQEKQKVINYDQQSKNMNYLKLCKKKKKEKNVKEQTKISLGKSA